MAKKLMSFKTKGMNRDLSVSAFNPEFSFENINLRLSTNESNTFMSWVNEKGTALINLIGGDWEKERDGKALNSILGTPIGTAIINNLLVVFTTEKPFQKEIDHIYILKYANEDKTELKCRELFHGDLGFDIEYPLETLVSYESSEVQKVYWVDGKNQPRVINIAHDPDTYYEERNPITTAFDFVTELKLKEEVTVTKSFESAGEFPAGVIQYAFTYYNKYGQESNIFYTTPLYYISYYDRGGAPDDKISNSFKIKISELDTRFEYVRIYSILRTSLNAVPFTKRVQDVKIEKETTEVSFIDTNVLGDTIDPTQLLYLGGESIIAETIEQKDNTLFLGNISIDRTPIDEGIKTDILSNNGVTKDSPLIKDNVESVLTERNFVLPSKGDNDKALGYINTLSAPEDKEYQGASAFKSNEYYRLGIQFQYKTGRWSEPCWIGDKRWENASTPGPTFNEDKGTYGTMKLPEFEYEIKHSNNLQEQEDIQTRLYNAGYRRIRPVYVQPQESDKTILCQGIINPTMYRICDRGGTAINTRTISKNGSLTTEEETVEYSGTGIYAQSSWLFRGWFKPDPDNSEGYRDKGEYNGGSVQFAGKLLSTYGNVHTEIPGYNYIPVSENERYREDSTYIWMQNYRSTEVMGYYSEGECFRIDNKFGTVHSPDIEFNDVIINTDLSGAELYDVGYTELGVTYGDIDIQTKTPQMGNSGRGFIKQTVKAKGSSALISGNFYEDHVVVSGSVDGKTVYSTYNGGYKPYLWPVFMWHRKGSLNNDVTRENRSAELEKKKISNYRNTLKTVYKKQDLTPKRDCLDIKVFSQEEASQIIKVNGKVYQGCVDTIVTPSEPSDFYIVGKHGTYKIDVNLPADWDAKFTDLPILKLHLNYPYGTDTNSGWLYLAYSYPTPYPNYKPAYDGFVPTNCDRWDPISKDIVQSNIAALYYFKDSVPIKYKSTPHIVVQFKDNVPEIYEWHKNDETDYLSIVELRREYYKDTLFGGTSDEALQAATWIPCGPVVNINPGGDTKVYFKWGDTYFQRYECLKTYPYTEEDLNQVIEIGSFMLETRVNIDGRYDRNRGQMSNLNVSPKNFNLINPVYSQQDNFFSYKILPEEYYKQTKFPNQITWTKTKENGADVDLWTNVTLASTLELDGNLGEISKLVRFNDQLLVFQDRGISQILYNENTQISTTEGVPIEIVNSGKVQGKRYFTNTIGCSNKWSIANTSKGIYFMDSNDKNIYIFNGELLSLSDTKGFNSWCKETILASSKKWNPKDFGSFVTYYDRLNQDILFINKDIALAFSEKLGVFTSFYDYGNAPFFCNFEDTGIWLTADANNYTVPWKHNAGKYCNFFNENKPYSITLVGNPEPQTDKIFTNLEFRASVVDDGEYDGITGKFTATLPFDSLETWNEYQHGYTTLEEKDGHDAMLHGGDSSSLKRKFRMWRCDIPRNNYPLPVTVEEREYEESLGVSRHIRKPMDRMRNPWLYMKLKKGAATGTYTEDRTVVPNTLPKIEIHDVIMTYFN